MSVLPADTIADLLIGNIDDDDPLVIAPTPDIERIRSNSGASIDLRLGTWFFSMKARSRSLIDEVSQDEDNYKESDMGDRHYVPFTEKYVLHPSSFVLAVTLEWVRLPLGLSATVTGKSSWGRRGLIVETAPGVHPGFSGCLALEVTNVGEIPIALSPGVEICQLALHRMETRRCTIPKSQFRGYRFPVVSFPQADDFVRKLRQE